MRHRTRNFSGLFVAVAVGLGSIGLRKVAPIISDPMGDFAYALAVFFAVGLAAPRADARVVAGVALAFCFAVEFSQLWHAPAIDAVRKTIPGRLLLGWGFDARDLAFYALGIGVGLRVSGIRKAPEMLGETAGTSP